MLHFINHTNFVNHTNFINSSTGFKRSLVTNNGLQSFDNNAFSKLDLVNTFNLISGKLLNLSNASTLQDFESVILSLDLKSKGFINSTDPLTIPLVGDLWSLLEITQFLQTEEIKLTESLKRVIILQLYYFTTVAILQRIVNKLVYLNNNPSSFEDQTNFIVLLDEYLRKVDPRIRKYLKGSRINIIDKIYIGFDTEFETKSYGLNDLLSTQLSATGTIIIRVNNIDKGFDFSKTILSDGMMVKDFSYENLLNKIPVLLTTNLLIKDVISELRHYMECSINDKFIDRLALMCKQGFIQKTSEGDEMIEYTVPLKVLNEVPVFVEYFKFHETGNTNPSFTDIIDNAIDLTTDVVNERYRSFMDYSNQVSNSIDSTPLLDTSNINVNNSDVNNDGDVISANTRQLHYVDLNNVVNPTNPFIVDNKHPNSLTKSINGLGEGVLRGEHRRSKLIIFGCHFSIADLTMLSDFDSIKHNFDSVQDTLLTVSKPFLLGKGRTIVLRDSMLLAPAGYNKLNSLGELYNLPKIDIGDYITHMTDLRNDDPKLFEQYALRDTVITLRHIIEMEKASYTITGVGSVPATLSGLARRFVLKFWEDNGIDLRNFIYFGKHSITDFGSMYTPKGLQSTGNVGLFLPLFLSGFRGGRNESYAYGINRDDIWFDYDIVSAYTTAMCKLGVPNFDKAVYIISRKGFNEFFKDVIKSKGYEVPPMSETTTLDIANIIDAKGTPVNTLDNSYSIFHVTFSFPKDTLYPCLPVSIDDTAALYPLSGETVATGYEIHLALSMNCVINLKRGVVIPFEVDKDAPYLAVIKYLQEQRRLHKPDTLYNLLYKQLGNSIYGQTGQGLGNNRKLNTRTGMLEDVGTSKLSNPVISSHITGLIRAVMGELLKQVNQLGGKIVSTTTDGFITNIENLTSKLDYNSTLLRMFADLRETLAGNRDILEIKKSSKGIISWATRGQLGLDPKSKISAMTGFQPRNFTMDDRVDLIENAFKDKSLRIYFGQRSLRKVNDIYKEGGHVTPKVNEKVFRVVYDNRRQIIDTGVSPFNNLLFSRPFASKDVATTIKTIGSLGSDLYAPHSEYTSKTGSKDYKDMAIRSFIRALTQSKLNLTNTFDGYKDLIEYTNNTFDVKLTPGYIAAQKRRSFIPKIVPSNKQTKQIVDLILIKYPDFDVNNFFQSNT